MNHISQKNKENLAVKHTKNRTRITHKKLMDNSSEVVKNMTEKTKLNTEKVQYVYCYELCEI